MPYILKDRFENILTYGETSFYPLEEGQTIDFIETPFHEYARRLVLSINGVSGQTHTASQSGPDLMLQVQTTLNLGNIDLLINNVIRKVRLTAGAGSLSLTSAQPGIVVITAADRKVFCPAGAGVLVIEIQPNR